MKSKPFLLHICSYSWETGGPASFIFNHAKFQVSKGVQVDIASAVYPWQKTYDLPVGVQLFQFSKSILSKILSEFSWPLIFWFFKNRNKYDVIHLHGLWHFGSILPFLIPCKAEKVITIHGFLDDFALKKSSFFKKIAWMLFQKRFIARADKLHAMNEEEYQYLCSLFPEKIKQIALIGNGIEDPLLKDFGTPDPVFVSKIEHFVDGAEFVFLFLSRKSSKKGIDILLASFEEMCSRYQWNARLLIAGPDDDYSDQLKSFLSTSNNQFILEVPLVSGAEKDYLYKNCTICVLPSYSEGFSIAALEAIAYGKYAIFSTKIGFANELIESQAATIIEPTFGHLVESFQNILYHKIAFSDYQKNARKLFLSNYQTLDISNKLFNFLFV
ncbi:MAG: hypothetical protein RJA76_2050 [Bacteroidota bacterium]|jgi:glycosyltransferase involved in cell wall biosynthesis